MTAPAAAEGGGVRLARLWLEFAAIYLVAPVALALLLWNDAVSTRDLRPAFAGFFVFALLMLAITPGHSWRRLLASNPLADWRVALAFTLGTAAVTVALTLWLMPHRLFAFPRHSPDFWWRLLLFYALLSAIPQGVIFRALFFSRYAALFPSQGHAIVASGLCFAFGHLFFWNWVALLLCFVGGVVFAWAHAAKDSFWFGNLLHMIGGWTIFTVGLGRYFYHGAI